MSKKVVILGGGFGGVSAAKALKKADVEITLIDRTNHNLFLPLLFQVAAAAISEGDIAIPIRSILRNQKNVRVLLDEVSSIDTENKKVITTESTIDYDYLIVSIGTRTSYFGHDEWEQYAPGLKTLADALTIRQKMLTSFEKAEKSDDEKEIEKLLTFVVVGGGPVGVEMAGGMAEISKRILKNDFRKLDPSKSRVLLIEALDKILPAFSPGMSRKAVKALEKIGVDVRLNTMVTGIDEKGVYTKDGLIETCNVVWGAGVRGHDVIKTMNVETEKTGRVLVDTDFSIKGHPEVFVIGDAAAFMLNGSPLPAVAPAATQPARYVAKIIKDNISKENRQPFKYFDKGNLATIGRSSAVLESHGLRATGFIAWIIWLVVHLAVLVGGRSRYKVLAEWIWHYTSKTHGVRIITEDNDNHA